MIAVATIPEVSHLDENKYDSEGLAWHLCRQHGYFAVQLRDMTWTALDACHRERHLDDHRHGA